METITYSELARRVGTTLLMNSIPNVDTYWFENVENYNPTNDKDEIDYDDGEYPEIYQWYAITQSGYEYLKRNTTEIIGYSNQLDTHYWCITHFGTSWDYVTTEIND